MNNSPDGFVTRTMEHLNFVDRLRQRLSEPLPGREAQFKMAFAHRVDELKDRLVAPPEAKIACVLLSLWHDGDAWRTALIRRTENPHDRHSGQISFPGGRHEASDGSYADTALREAHEETGIQPHQVEIIGRLSDLYIPVSNFAVHPFVGVLHEKPQFQRQIGEVEQIFTPPVSHFQDPATRRTADVLVGQQYTVREVPCYMVEDRAVWGATAMILSEFLELLAE